MDDYTRRAREHAVVIRAAQQIDAKTQVLAELTRLARLMMEAGKGTEAANTLAYVMNHPDVPYDTYDRADDLWIELEAALCPRVIADAKAEASYITMRGAVEAALATFLDDDAPDQLEG